MSLPIVLSRVPTGKLLMHTHRTCTRSGTAFIFTVVLLQTIGVVTDAAWAKPETKTPVAFSVVTRGLPAFVRTAVVRCHVDGQPSTCQTRVAPGASVRVYVDTPHNFWFVGWRPRENSAWNKTWRDAKPLTITVQHNTALEAVFVRSSTCRFIFDWENDLLTNRDEGYSNGMFVSLDNCGNGMRNAAAYLGRGLGFTRDPLGLYLNFGVFAGHRMFTPGNLRLTLRIVDDRPYAGWLFGGARFQVGRIRDASRLPRSWLATFEFSAGIVGPAAFAKQLQIGWHYVLRKVRQLPFPRRPMGWNNQLANRPAVDLRMALEKEIFNVPVFWHGLTFHDRRITDVFVVSECHLGNVMLNCGAGVRWRLGWIAQAFGWRSPIQITTPELSRSRGPEPLRFELFVWGRFFTRLAAYNVFVDGDGLHDIKLNPVVNEAEFGATNQTVALSRIDPMDRPLCRSKLRPVQRRRPLRRRHPRLGSLLNY